MEAKARLDDAERLFCPGRISKEKILLSRFFATGVTRKLSRFLCGQGTEICCYEKLVKVCVKPVVHATGAFPGFRSVKRLRVFLLDGMQVYHRVSPPPPPQKRIDSAVLIYTLVLLCFHKTKSAEQ